MSSKKEADRARREKQSDDTEYTPDRSRLGKKYNRNKDGFKKNKRRDNQGW